MMDISLTTDNELIRVPLEKERPGLVGPSLKAMDGTRIPPTIAYPEIVANGNLIGSEKAVSYSSNGFVKLMREAQELLIKDEQAFKLVVFIALGAVRVKSKFSDHDLEVGQAFISGCHSLGWSRQVYRDTQNRVEFKYKLATFKGTSKGTIATLLNTDVCDINVRAEEPSKEPTKNHQGTNTTLLQEECKNERKKKQLARAQDFSSFGKFVKLTANEYEELAKTHGKPQLDVMIEKINDHCESTGKSYKGFAATIRNWFRREKPLSASAPSPGKTAASKPESLGDLLSEFDLGSYYYSAKFGTFELFSSLGHSMFSKASTDIAGIRAALKALNLGSYRG